MCQEGGKGGGVGGGDGDQGSLDSLLAIILQGHLEIQLRCLEI